MATKQAHKRLSKEYLDLLRNKPDFFAAKPLDNNILEWHYVLTGPGDSPFAGGEYWGKLLFPSDYPFKPPGIKMMTPNGRFKPDARLCLTISDFHPESWNPSWSVSTILTGLLSFMLESEVAAGTVAAPVAEIRELARRSRAYNRHVPKFCEVFPELASAASAGEASAEAADGSRARARVVSAPAEAGPAEPPAPAAEPPLSPAVAGNAGAMQSARLWFFGLAGLFLGVFVLGVWRRALEQPS